MVQETVEPQVTGRIAVGNAAKALMIEALDYSLQEATRNYKSLEDAAEHDPIAAVNRLSLRQEMEHLRRLLNLVEECDGVILVFGEEPTTSA